MNVTINFWKADHNTIVGMTNYDVSVVFDDERGGHIETQHIFTTGGKIEKDIAGYLSDYYRGWIKLVDGIENPNITISERNPSENVSR